VQKKNPGFVDGSLTNDHSKEERYSPLGDATI
jgi:hypothetical protein